MSETMRLRRLTIEDVPRLIELQQQDFPEALWETAEKIREVVESCEMNVGIEDDGILVAAALTHPGTTPGVVDRASHDVYFFSLEVLPAYRGKGLGSQLVRERLRIAHTEGRAVELHCMHAEYPAYSAQSLAACGYQIVEDEWLPEFYKTWGLDAGARHLRLEPQ